MEQINLVVLAGGTAARLGGVSKPDVQARGKRLLDHVLNGAQQLLGQELAEVCVVAPPEVAVPNGVLRTLEDPPLGGPVSGIAAGLKAFSTPSEVTGILTCDAPDSPAVLAQALEVLRMQRAAGYLAAVPLFAGHRQYLQAVYVTEVLRETAMPGGVALRNVSVNRTFASINSFEFPADQQVQDLDTWDEIESWEQVTSQQ